MSGSARQSRGAACRLLLWLAVLPAPAALAAPFAFVTNQGADSVSVIDLATFKAVGRIAVGHDPAGVAVSRDGRAVYVTLPTDGQVSRIDTTNRSVTWSAPAGEGPLGVAADPRRDRIYVADWYRHRIAVIDTAGAHRAVDEFVTGKAPSGIAVSADGDRLVVANRDDDTVTVFDLDSRLALATLAVGRAPFGVTLDAAGRRIFVANVQSNDVTIIDLKALRVIATVPVGEAPYCIAHDPKRNRIYVTNEQAGTLSVVDLETRREIAAVAVGEYPEGVGYVTALDRVYVANWLSNDMVAFDPDRLTIAGSVPCEDGSRAFGNFILQ